MSRESAARIAWTCPECDRTYRIFRSRPRPVRCANCEEKRSSEGDSDVEFAAVPQQKTPRTIVVSPPVPRSASVGRESMTDSGEELSAPTQQQIAEVLEHLTSISRTMKLFRRFLWAIGAVALLNVLLVGASVIYGIWMMGSMSSLFSSGGGNGGGIGAGVNLNVNGQRGLNALPPQVRKELKVVEDYSDTLNELLQETR